MPGPREHLARCQHCRAEANRWDLVARGVRGLAAATPQAAPPARPRHTRPPVLAGPRRRLVLAAGAAAALVLLGAVGYGASSFVHITFGTAGTGAGTVLTAVTGCSQLEQASGMLEQVNGTSLVIKAAGGQPVTLTTTASTFVSMSGPLLSDITDGASVMVRGSRSGRTIAAAIVTVGQPFSAVNPPGFVPLQAYALDLRHTLRHAFITAASLDAGVPLRDVQEALFVESLLPQRVLRTLTGAEMDVYRRPFREPGEGRRPTLTWPRQLPIDGEPADVCQTVASYGRWLATSPLPKLFINADPGTISAQERAFCRTWPNQAEVTVPGLHFLQEDSPHQIGQALARWNNSLHA